MRNDTTEAIHFDATVTKRKADGTVVASSYLDPHEELVPNSLAPAEPDGE